MENTSTESAHVTKARYRRHRERRAEWIEHAGSVGELLESLADDTERVFLCGAMPWGVGVAGLRLWVGGELPTGWSATSAGHYMDGDTPTLRFARHGRRVEILAAAMWFGDISPAHGARAWNVLDAAVAARFHDGRLLSTPASTGRDLFLRSLGRREFPVLSNELQDLIRSTSGQGRIEWFDGPSPIAELSEYDGRMMYAGCARELGHGTPTLDTVDEYAGYVRGRYDVTATVPAAWAHVGLLGVMDGREGWRWPAEPGETFRTWVDSSELHVAIEYGWQVRIHQRMLFPDHRGRPLDGWIRGLLDVLDRAPVAPGGVGERAVRTAVRAMILHGIGAMHGRPHKVSRSSPDASEVPAGASPSFDRWTGLYSWTEQRPALWPELSHPEWSAAVWGRARSRLCVGTGGAGMLTVPRSAVVACRTDAIYLADHHPDWQDSGKVGAFREVGRWCRRQVDGGIQLMTRPSTLAELQAVTS